MAKTASIWQKSPVLRAFSGLKKALKRVFSNIYEGASWWSSDRSWIPEYNPQDAKLDLTELELTELIRKSRYFVKNSPLVHKLRGNFRQYTVGSKGVVIVPASSDPEFNAEVEKEWKAFCKSPDRSSNKNYATLCGEGADCLFTDGNFLILKSMEESPEKVPGVPSLSPKIQLLEIHRLKTPDELASSKNLIKGIQTDSKGKPIGYWIADGIEGDKTSFKKAENVIHVFESNRPGQYFGEPLMTPALNRIHDLDDLQILQMRKAKQNASIANVLKNEAGELSDEDAMRRARTDDTTDSQGTDTTVGRISHYQKKLGGETIALKNGEELDQFRSESPSVTEQWHWEKCESEACVTAGQSRMLVFPDSIQGTVARADLEVAAAFFNSYFGIQSDAWSEVYLWWLEWAVKNKKNLKNKPDDYNTFECRGPRGVNVDLGWNSDAVIAELQAGIRTIPGTYAELQQDYRKELRQIAISKRYAKDLEKEFDLEEGEVIPPSDALVEMRQPTPAENPPKKRGNR